MSHNSLRPCLYSAGLKWSLNFFLTPKWRSKIYEASHPSKSDGIRYPNNSQRAYLYSFKIWMVCNISVLVLPQRLFKIINDSSMPCRIPKFRGLPPYPLCGCYYLLFLLETFVGCIQNNLSEYYYLAYAHSTVSLNFSRLLQTSSYMPTQDKNAWNLLRAFRQTFCGVSLTVDLN